MAVAAGTTMMSGNLASNDLEEEVEFNPHREKQSEVHALSSLRKSSA